MSSCSICGGDRYVFHKVLWPELIAQWELSDEEVEYVNMQQGCLCEDCGASLRVIALGQAIQFVSGSSLPVQKLVTTGQMHHMRVLDLNGAEGLSSVLFGLPNYRRGDYPEVDMHALPFANNSFDVVLHSDTLEHLAHPVKALEECRRVLSAQGRLCFTVPMIVGRLSRTRAGLAKSYHGNPADGRDDFLVHTEFGADAWCYVLRAGFTRLSINQVRYPAAMAITAWD